MVLLSTFISFVLFSFLDIESQQAEARLLWSQLPLKLDYTGSAGYENLQLYFKDLTNAMYTDEERAEEAKRTADAAQKAELEAQQARQAKETQALAKLQELGVNMPSDSLSKTLSALAPLIAVPPDKDNDARPSAVADADADADADAVTDADPGAAVEAEAEAEADADAEAETEAEADADADAGAPKSGSGDHADESKKKQKKQRGRPQGSLGQKKRLRVAISEEDINTALDGRVHLVSGKWQDTVKRSQAIVPGNGRQAVCFSHSSLMPLSFLSHASLMPLLCLSHASSTNSSSWTVMARGRSTSL
jgi:hypothetical protein